MNKVNFNKNLFFWIVVCLAIYTGYEGEVDLSTKMITGVFFISYQIWLATDYVIKAIKK